MNLSILAGCFILIWLPLATLKLHNSKNTSRDYFLSKISDGSFRANDDDDDDDDANKMVTKNDEKNLVEAKLNRTSLRLFLSSSSSSSSRVEEEEEEQDEGESETFSKMKTKDIDDDDDLTSSTLGRNDEADAKIAHKPYDVSSSALIPVDESERNKSFIALTDVSESKKRRKRKWDNVNTMPDIYRKRDVVKVASETETLEDTTEFEDYDEDELNENDEGNATEMGSYLGAPCESTCSEKLLHVRCDPKHRICQCEEKYPVQIGVGKGCEKPKKLGDQCFYPQTCAFSDPNAVCTQINHNAICQCKPGFHTVALKKGVKRTFCSEDIVVVSADLPTLLGVATGIAILTGLICFVLKLFSGSRYPPARHYGNANLAPPLLISSDNQWINGIPLTVHGRPSSRSSCQRSTTSLSQYSRSKGVLVPASRAGAARAAAILLIPCHLQASRHSDSEVVKNSNNDDTDIQDSEIDRPSLMGSRRHSLSSVQSTTSSQKSISYSTRRFEQENQQREQRAAMKAAREEAARIAALPTPSPMSTDEVLLIPASSNNEEEFLCQSTSDVAAQSEPPALAIIKGNTGLSSRQQ